MSQKQDLARALFLLRVSVFVVFFVWGLDKLIRPEHASAVFQNFYFSPAFGPIISYILGVIQLTISIGFLIGFQKKWTYGAVFVMHLVSTLTSYKQYLSPYEGPHILFFAAWPMLAACFALYILRDADTLWVHKD